MADKNETEPVYITLTLSRREIDRIVKNHIEGLDVMRGDTDASQVDVQFKDGDFEDFAGEFFAYIELTF